MSKNTLGDLEAEGYFMWSCNAAWKSYGSHLQCLKHVNSKTTINLGYIFIVTKYLSFLQRGGQNIYRALIIVKTKLLSSVVTCYCRLRHLQDEVHHHAERPERKVHPEVLSTSLIMHSSPLLTTFNAPSHAHLLTSHSSALHGSIT